MLSEFREFVNRGNVVELAVAFVMGLAFNPIVTALVDRVLMPGIGLLVGEPNFDRVGTFACRSVAEGADPATGIAVGQQVCTGSLGAVITATVNFLLVAFAVFLLVRFYNRMMRKQAEEPTPEGPPEDVVLLREIRDALQT